MMQEFKEYICDNICKYPCTCRNEEHLMEMCEECQVEEMLEGIVHIRELPQKQTVYTTNPLIKAYTDGYNKCIDEILGGAE